MERKFLYLDVDGVLLGKNDPRDMQLVMARHRAFTRAGRYVVSNCDVLIALLDDRAASGGGFTAETVEYARNCERPIIIIRTEGSSDPLNPFDIKIEKGHGLNAGAISGLEMLNICISLRDFVRQNWLQEQIDYHVDKASVAGQWSRWLERTGFVVFVIAIFAPLLHLIFFNSGMEFRQESLEKLLTFAALTLPAVGAAIGGVRSHREFSRFRSAARTWRLIFGSWMIP